MPTNRSYNADNEKTDIFLLISQYFYEIHFTENFQMSDNVIGLPVKSIDCVNNTKATC